MDKGLVSNIQHFSVHDGPGIRTIVFLKGCNMKCLWCSNPEMIGKKPELMYTENVCLGCGFCIKACSNKVISKGKNDKINIDKLLCIGCALCAEACPSHALSINGVLMTVDEVLDELKKDEVFYESSSGGITVSGGEPFLQTVFLHKLLKACKDNDMHTAVETAGNYNMKDVDDILKYVDLFLYDIKIYDNDMHKVATGVSNNIIIENIKYLRENNKEVIIRVPLIPNYSATEDNIRQIGLLAKTLNIGKVHLLPYHEYGKEKYNKIHQVYKLMDVKILDNIQIDKFRSILQDKGLVVVIAGEE